jgi:hypothetical protein
MREKNYEAPVQLERTQRILGPSDFVFEIGADVAH